jgi:hypothetical protein
VWVQFRAYEGERGKVRKSSPVAIVRDDARRRPAAR